MNNTTQADAYDRGFNHGFYAPTHFIDLVKEFHGNQELISAYERGFSCGTKAHRAN